MITNIIITVIVILIIIFLFLIRKEIKKTKKINDNIKWLEKFRDDLKKKE